LLLLATDLSRVANWRSIDVVPEEERHGTPVSQFTLWFSANMQASPAIPAAHPARTSRLDSRVFRPKIGESGRVVEQVPRVEPVSGGEFGGSSR
jgi:hypothetical protein